MLSEVRYPTLLPLVIYHYSPLLTFLLGLLIVKTDPHSIRFHQLILPLALPPRIIKSNITLNNPPPGHFNLIPNQLLDIVSTLVYKFPGLLLRCLYLDKVALEGIDIVVAV